MLLTQPYSGPKVKTRFAVSMSGATTGISIADNVGSVFTPAMMRKFMVYIPATMAKEITVYSDGVRGIFITKDKKIRVNYYGIYESMPLALSNNYATIAISVNDNGADAATLMFVVDGVQLGSTQVYGFSPTYLRSLLDTEDGFFLLASLGHGTLTNAGTNKLQAPGDAVGLMKDLGANAINFSQATASARPVIGRQPLGGVRNLQRMSNGTTGWAASGSTHPALTQTANHLGKECLKIDFPTGVSGYSGCRAQRVHAPFSISSGNNYTGFFSISFSRPLVSTETIMCLLTGTASLGNFIITAGNQGAAASEFVRFTVPASTTGLTGGDYFTFFPSTNLLSPLTAYVTELQAEVGASVTAHQITGASLYYDVTESGVKDVSFAYFDRADDVVSGTVPAITSGTMILAGTNGIWIDENYSVSAGTLSFGPTTVTGCPAGLLSVVGKVIGAFCINRSLTTPEMDQWKAAFIAAGAPEIYLA